MNLILHVIAGLLMVACTADAQDRLAKLIDSIATGPLDRSILYAVESERPEARMVRALKSAFENRTKKEEKQWVALALLKLGERSETYYDFLAGYASEAIQDHAPSMVKYDSNGHGVRGELDGSFLKWCTANEKNPEIVARLQAYDYPTDVRMLAEAQDRRAADLFRLGLGSPNPWVVAASVEGLGRLHDSAAIPLVEKTVQTMNSESGALVASALPWFDTNEAYRILQRLIPDDGVRKMWIDNINRVRNAEARRPALRGLPAAK